MPTILTLLKTEMPTPRPWGWFHLAWLVAALFAVAALKNKQGEKTTERVFAIYGWTALVLEALKQFSWSFSFDGQGALVFSYQWYAAPFQLCTIPAYVCALYSFIKSARLRAALRGFLAYFTLLGSIAVAIVPVSVFTSEALINVHTSFLHAGALFVSLWLLASGRAHPRKDFWSGYFVFLFFAVAALLLNITVYHLFRLGPRGVTFDMFYISPYYQTSLPVFDVLDAMLPYPVFLLVYLFAFLLGGTLIALAQKGAERLAKKRGDRYGKAKNTA